MRQTGETLSGLLLRLAGEWWLNRLVHVSDGVLFAAAGKKYVAEGSQGLPPHPLTDAARVPYNIP